MEARWSSWTKYLLSCKAGTNWLIVAKRRLEHYCNRISSGSSINLIVELFKHCSFLLKEIYLQHVNFERAEQVLSLWANILQMISYPIFDKVWQIATQALIYKHFWARVILLCIILQPSSSCFNGWWIKNKSENFSFSFQFIQRILNGLEIVAFKFEVLSSWAFNRNAWATNGRVSTGVMLNKDL